MSYPNVYILMLSALVLTFASCRRTTNEPTLQFSPVLDKGYVSFYGDYYSAEGLDRNVLSVDLYSPGITLDSVGRISGTGTNVYLSDVFLTPKDIFLPEAEYRSDTTYEPLTFLAGIEYEGFVSGAYLLNITETGYSVVLVNKGTMQVVQQGDSTIIRFELLLNNADRTLYKGEYRGVLPYYDFRDAADVKRKTTRYVR